MEVPKKRSAFVANTSLDAVLALAKFPGGNRTAALKAFSHASRVAVALLAQGEVVKTLLAALTLDAVKVI